MNKLVILKEFFEYMIENRKWFLLPIVFVFILLGFLILFAQSGVAPFIYTLF